MRTPGLLLLLLAVPALAGQRAQSGGVSSRPDGDGRTPPISGQTTPLLLSLVVSADVTRPPDSVRLTAGVTTDAASASQALAANAVRMTAVIAALNAAGVAQRDVQTSGLSVTPQYRYLPEQAPQLTGYQARNQVTLTSRKLGDAGKLVDALVKAGANEVQGPEFLLSDSDAALDEARTVAVARGRARAELYARAAGTRLRRIVSISETVGSAPEPRPMMRMAAAEAAVSTPMQPGELQLSVQLTMSFELEP